MSLLKKQSLWIVMSLILIVSAGLCVYSISSYQGSGAASSGIGRPQQSFGGQGGGPAPGQRAGQGGPQGQQRPQGAPATPPAGAASGDDADAQGSAARGGAKGGPAPPAGGAGFGGRTGGASADAAYSTPLAVYTVLFFLLAAAGYAWIARVKPALRLSARQKQALVWTVLGTGLLLRIAAAPWIAGHPFDIGLFKSWAAAAADHLTGFYVNGSSDYPPFYVYILYAIGKLAAMSALGPYITLLIKLPSIVADVATAYLLYRIARRYVSFGLSLLIAAFYTFNPAVFINSTFWGQVDSFFTLMVVGAAILLSRGRLAWATAVFTAAVLMKPQGILYLPLLGFELIRRKQWKPWLVAAASAIGTILVVALPFSIGQSPLWLYKLYAGTVNEYPYASVNAYNFFALLGANYKQDTSTLFLFSYHTWGMVFIVLVTLFSWRVYHKGGARLAPLAALLQIAGVFTFSSSMHERYLFPAAALALLAYNSLKDRRLLWLAAGFSLTVFMNTYAVFYNATKGAAAYNFTLFFTSLINVLLCLYLLKVAWDLAAEKKAMALTGNEPNKPNETKAIEAAEPVKTAPLS